MGDYIPENIRKIITSINWNFFLPDIQRSFVWEEEKVQNLFDSLMKKYPIGTFLFWTLNKKELGDVEKHNNTKIKMYKFVDSNFKESEEEMGPRERDEYNLVLDGQQRLTSLYIALRGTWTERKKVKELYFDVLSKKDEKESEDDISYRFDFFPRENGPFFLEEKKKDSEQRLWVNVKKIYELADAEAIQKLPEEITQSKPASFDLETKGRIFTNIHTLHFQLNSGGVIYYYPVYEKDYDKVLDIFVRANSGGTKLTYSDLLFSKIKLKWLDAREAFKGLLDDINDDGRFEFNNDFVLKTCLVVFSKKAQEVSYKIKNLSESKITQIRDSWAQMSNSIRQCVDLLEAFGIKDKKLLPSYNATIPIIYYIFKNGLKAIGSHKGAITTQEQDRIRRWLLQALLAGAFSGQSDTVLYQAKTEVENASTKEFPVKEINNKIATKKNIEITQQSLNGTKYNSTESFLFLSFVYELNFKPNFFGNVPQQDHLFSRKELGGLFKKDAINDIGNIRYVGASENNWKGDTPFGEWMNWMKQNHPEDIPRHLIPDGNWSKDNYRDFVEKRKSLIFEKVKEHI